VAILAWLIFDESVTVVGVVSAALIVCGLLLLVKTPAE
jgi:multidrug transporter EmrE-like cation transporter